MSEAMEIRYPIYPLHWQLQPDNLYGDNHLYFQRCDNPGRTVQGKFLYKLHSQYIETKIPNKMFILEIFP